MNSERLQLARLPPPPLLFTRNTKRARCPAAKHSALWAFKLSLRSYAARATTGDDFVKSQRANTRIKPQIKFPHAKNKNSWRKWSGNYFRLFYVNFQIDKNVKQLFWHIFTKMDIWYDYFYVFQTGGKKFWAQCGLGVWHSDTSGWQTVTCVDTTFADGLIRRKSPATCARQHASSYWPHSFSMVNNIPINLNI